MAALTSRCCTGLSGSGRIGAERMIARNSSTTSERSSRWWDQCSGCWDQTAYAARRGIGRERIRHRGRPEEGSAQATD